MNKTRIEWTNYSWNPIKGACPQACWFCYARAMYKRFKRDPELSWDGKVPILSNKKPSRIFICSTIEMFHPQIPKEWRDRIFRTIEADFNKKHTFQILTKLPQNIDRKMPDNVHLGVSITNNFDRQRWPWLYIWKKARIKFISYEPLLENIIALPRKPDWIIVGRLTGHGHEYDPKLEWIKDIVRHCADYGIKIFLKDNLKEIWDEPLIQEFP